MSKQIHARRFGMLLAGASAMAMVATPQTAWAQADETTNEAEDSVADENAIVVTGIRASLAQAMNIKREAQGVVDAISAEDIGKFPDTNLAESLQRITGVSIDRQSGEGSKVTVRGFGPEFNLVLLNGRQMPASELGSCCAAPASRSFDFANLASEGIAAVEVYKSGRASLPTGGIGSVINIRTPRPLDRPGLQGSVAAKAVYDTSYLDGAGVTPEFSGIVSQTFADNRVGILLAGSYQERKGSVTQFNAGWREGYTGAENNWGSLPVDANDWRVMFVNPNLLNQIENRPGPTDIYQVTQNAGYDFTSFERTRINGQAVLQFQPTDTLDATVDYVFSQNTFDARTNSIGVWFNHVNTSSSWTDGPAAGPNFYSEAFGPGEGKDLAITGAVAANRNINHSFGGNLKWEGIDRLRVELDAHHSTATSKPTSPYGSNIAVGSAIYGVRQQTVDFTTELPVISVEMYPGAEIDASNIRPAGNAFRNGYMRDRINQVALRAGYDVESDFIESLDFGATYTDNKVRTAFGNLQTDTWGGTLSAADTPDDLYTLVNLNSDLSGMEGANASNIIPVYFQVNTPALIDLLDQRMGICTTPWTGTPTGEGCLAEYTVDRRLREKSMAYYGQTTHRFDLGGAEANLRLGLRYEKTDLDSSSLVPVPTGTVWVAQNEISLQYDDDASEFVTAENSYDHWLPAIDLDVRPMDMDNVILRASYSHTITRPDYASLNSGATLNSPARPGAGGGSTGGSGNPMLDPYLSKNIDLSAEWYFGSASYASVGFFSKRVSNFFAVTNVQEPRFGLVDPSRSAPVLEAYARLGAGTPYSDILNYVATNYPNRVIRNSAGMPTGVVGAAGDPELVFTLSQPNNIDEVAHLNGWEFAIQHSFWDTGFGAILNYTIVNSDTDYDNTLRYTEEQFAVTGVSDSANAVLFYDKNNLQARVAYNWRDGFLSGYGFDPFYIDSYGQFDVSASYEFDNGLSFFVEGINVTNEDRRGTMRNSQTVFFAAPGKARYAAGVRFTF